LDRAPRGGRQKTVRRGARRAATAGVVLALLVALPARAQSTLWGERGTLLVPGGETVPARNFNVSLAGNAASQGFALSPLAVAAGVSDRLELGASLLDWPGDDASARGARLDVRLSLRFRPWYRTATLPAVALGIAADHLVRGHPDLQPSVALSKDFGPLLLAAQLGWRRPGRRDALDPAGTFYGMGAALSATPAATVFLDATGATGSGQPWLSVMPGFAWSLLGPDPMAARREALRAQGRKARAEAEAAGSLALATPAERALPEPDPGAAGASAPPWATGLFAARKPVLAHPGRLTFFVTAGPSFGGPEKFRVLAGIQISTFDELLQDSDADGIPDRFDRCPYEPEDYDGYEDDDGCPDNGAEVLRKLAEERARAAAAGSPQFTTETPRFRIAIPLGEVPASDSGPPSRAPMYAPLPPPAAPPPKPGSAPPSPAKPLRPPPPKASGPQPQTFGPSPQAYGPRPPVSGANAVGKSAPGKALGSSRAERSPSRGAPATLLRPARLPAMAPSAALEPPLIAVVALMPASMQRRAAGMPPQSGPAITAFGSGATVVAAAFARVDGTEPFRRLDERAIEGVVRFAAPEGDQLFVWARVSGADLPAEAERRAQVVAAVGAPVPLEPGDAALRQLREALDSHRREIESCLASMASRLARADGRAALLLAVGPDGTVRAFSVLGGPHATVDVQACLARTAAAWRLPASEGGYEALALIAMGGRRR
jgi:hypothetical protein